MNQLDEALRNWADQSEPDSSAIDALKQHILDSAAAERVRDVTVQSAADRDGLRPTTRPGPRGSWVWLVALACVLGVVVFLGRESNSGKHTLPEVVVATSPATDLLATELDRLFEGQWRWHGEVNGRSHLETSDELVAEAADDDLLRVAVRLTVVERRRGEGRWRVVWDASVLARSDEWVQLPASLTGRDSVSLWAYVLPDGSVMVESDVSLSGPVSVDLATGRLFSRGTQAVELWAEQQGDREVRVLESTVSSVRRST